MRKNTSGLILIAFSVATALGIYLLERPAGASIPTKQDLRPDPIDTVPSAIAGLAQRHFEPTRVQMLLPIRGGVSAILPMEKGYDYAVMIYCEEQPCDSTVDVRLQREGRNPFPAQTWKDPNIVVWAILDADTAQIAYNDYNRGTVAVQWWRRKR